MTVTEGSPGGNMEGKETLFGPEGSALMTVGTMGTTAGATDSALDSYTPVGGTLRTEKERAGKWLTATAG